MHRRRFLANLAAFSTAAFARPGFAANEFGHFDGDVIVRWEIGSGGKDRKMLLLENFAFVDPAGKRWEARKGYPVDGASIPPILWSFVGSPFVGRYRRASVVHDYYCHVQTETWEDTHRMFYNACRAGDVPERKAKRMYTMVYRFGPDWPAPRPTKRRAAKKKAAARVRIKAMTPLVDRPPMPTAEELDGFQDLLDWVETDSPSLEEIESRVDAISKR